MQIKILVLLGCVLLHAGSALAESFEEALESFGTQEVTARIDDGVIRSINLAEKSAIISGHKYHFAPLFSGTPLKIKLLGTKAKAIELLEPGMKVRVTYGDSGVARIAVAIEQLPYDAEVEH